MMCRLCGSAELRSVVDLGATPPCEKFLTEDELDRPEKTFPLHLQVCEECLLLQIPALITPEETFADYAYSSSFSASWVEHARRFVEKAIERTGFGDDGFIVEVASNDGYLLQHVVDRGINCLGIEPSVNVGEQARERGVPTLTAFLDEQTAAEVVDVYGHADLVVANNVYAHIPDLLGFTRALRMLVADDGWVSIEVHHALNLIRYAQFDTIYHEHFQYYTVLTAQRALMTAGLELVDVELLATHGGSIRLWARPTEASALPADSVAQILQTEADAGLHDLSGYVQLQERVDWIKNEFLQFLLEAKQEGRRVVGYGAPGKGNTLLNYCGIRPDLMAYTVDKNPYKHGRYTPGTRIPVYPIDRIDADRPDVIVVLPWNLETEITEQLRHVGTWGGELIYPLPQLRSVTGADLTTGSVR
ncbi:methyltransferase domain-containing protein [Gordonia lacunae]|uniref:class I SAM-dependent methyltransferase n=1 Tax=Gordonia TaxID=2053 RepID=UPI00200AEAC6|nr:class I SAM-dependent methyltransferase [Gordonia terrae]UPW11964.1 class I SAM-dependent methyltransferase [Gordonia terrae]